MGCASQQVVGVFFVCLALVAGQTLRFKGTPDFQLEHDAATSDLNLVGCTSGTVGLCELKDAVSILQQQMANLTTRVENIEANGGGSAGGDSACTASPQPSVTFTSSGLWTVPDGILVDKIVIAGGGGREGTRFLGVARYCLAESRRIWIWGRTRHRSAF